MKREDGWRKNIEDRLERIETEVSNHIRADLKFLRGQLWALTLVLIAGLLGAISVLLNRVH